MRIANVIIAHKNPEQLFTLVQQFPADRFHNWIHVDLRCPSADYAKVAALPHVTLLQLRKVAWAGVSFIEVTLDLFKEIAKSKEKFMYVNLMSGLDFPIKPVGQFYDFLNTAKNQDRNEFFHITDTSTEWPADFRYEKIHFNEWTTMRGRYFTERIINKFVPKRKYFHGKLVPYGRSAWFTTTWEFTEYALDYFRENPGYLRFLRTVWCPDELVFNSLIMNSPFRDRVYDHHLRLIDWSEKKANPKTFRAEDYQNIISSDRFLARKFDAGVDERIIDQLKEFISLPK